MAVDGRLNLEQHCGLLAEFHQNSPWIHSCYMLLSFGDNSDDVTTTEHDCGAAIGRRFLQNFWVYGSYGQVSFRQLQTFHFLQQVLEEIELNCLYQDKIHKQPTLPRVHFQPTWCPHFVNSWKRQTCGTAALCPGADQDRNAVRIQEGKPTWYLAVHTLPQVLVQTKSFPGPDWSNSR